MMASNVKRDWGRLARGYDEAAFGLRSVRFEGLPGLEDLEFPIGTPLSLIIGANGAGKTTLLKLIWAALDPSQAIGLPPFSGSVQVEVVANGEVVSRKVAILNGEVEQGVVTSLVCTHIDAAGESRRYKEKFVQLGGFDQITEGIGVRELSGADLSDVKYLVRRDYEEVRFFEVEVDPEKWVPFFQVRYGDTLYDSRTMGAGELAALHLWWALKRCDDTQFVLVEEPEALLSHASQEAIGNFLARQTLAKQLCLVASTHSAPIITAASDSCTLLLVRGQHGVKIEVGNMKPTALNPLGIAFPWRAYLFVEDMLAKEASVRILQNFAPKLARTCWVEAVGGEGEVRKILKTISPFGGPIAFVGMVDGDVDLSGFEKDQLPALKLPGSDPIEVQLQRVARDRTDELSKSLGEPNFAMTLAGLEGVDYHEWFERLAKELALSKTQLFMAFFRFWIDQEAVKDACREIANRLQEILDAR